MGNCSAYEVQADVCRALQTYMCRRQWCCAVHLSVQARKKFNLFALRASRSEPCRAHVYASQSSKKDERKQNTDRLCLCLRLTATAVDWNCLTAPIRQHGTGTHAITPRARPSSTRPHQQRCPNHRRCHSPRSTLMSRFGTTPPGQLRPSPGARPTIVDGAWRDQG